LAQEGCKGFDDFLIKKHDHISFQITITLFSKD